MSTIRNEIADRQTDALLTPFSSSITIPVKAEDHDDRDEVNHTLPPITLHIPKRDHSVSAFGLVAVLMAIAVGIANLPTNKSASTSIDNNCGIRVATGAEKRFQIDLNVVTSLSFANAKVLDVAWDAIVGQGGRFLHGWMLYHASTRGLTWMLEHTALPYRFQINLLFSTVSISTLISTMRLELFGKSSKHSVRLVLMVMSLVFTIAYVLVFATVWGAATGYVNPSSAAYPLFNNAFVTKDSSALQLCWVGLDFERIGIKSPVSGPTFAEAFPGMDMTGNFSSNISSVLYDPANLLWHNSSDNGSTTFASLYAYALTKRNIQALYTSSIYAINDVSLDLPVDITSKSFMYWDMSYNNITRQFKQGPSSKYFPLNRTGHVDWYTSSGMLRLNEDDGLEGHDYYPSANELVEIINGFEFAGSGETGVIADDLMANPNITQRSKWYSYVLASNASFSLDADIQPGPGIVPYNSSLWYNGNRVQIPAPFLEFDNTCSWFPNHLSVCLCFDGRPVTTDWRTTDGLMCINDINSYIWGFSSFLLIIGLCLESVWLIVCWWLWWRPAYDSKLIIAKRTRTGTVRSILDLSEAINRDLGPHTCLYPEKELWKTLTKCEPVAYSVNEMDGIAHVGLVPVPKGTQSEMPKLVSGKVYG